MTTLVTGATGFIGSRLLVPGDRGLTTRRSQSSAAIVLGNLLAPASLRDACRNVDSIVHCAGRAHVDAADEEHWRVDFEGTRNLIGAALESGVKRFVFLSSVKAMADPGDECVDEEWPGEANTAYGRAKRAAEDLVLEAGAKHGLHVVNLRLAMVYGRGGRGNLERLANAVRRGWFPPLPETGNRRSLVHVQDAVAAVRCVLATPAAAGQTYIVADPTAYSGREIYDIVRATLGRPPIRWRVPAVLLRQSGRMGDHLARSMGRPIALNSKVIARLLDSACYSPAKIQRELAWTARVDLRCGVAEMLGRSL